LKHRDVDEALDNASAAVEDWSGGTRIGQCLHAFNRDWSRRVLGQGAVVLLISDGLDRDAGEGLGEEMRRLHGSCRRLIWLNPLLRFEGFAPKSLGVRAILPHVDEFRSVHSLNSLQELADALGPSGSADATMMAGWKAKLQAVEAAEIDLEPNQ
ncbi:MAG: VWA domain-containing protein, partial [Proteobacteria bacterium]|nr:VWA domain-containing protein [Pseudomonadota bacterium]